MAQQYLVRDNNHIIKGYFRSAAVLWRGILQILYAGLYIGLILIASSTARGIILITDSDYEVLKIYDTVNISVLVSSFVATVPFLLIAVAYIIIYAKSRNEAIESRPDAGITILNVFAIIELAGAILASIGMIAGIVLTFINEMSRTSGSYDIVPLIASAAAGGIGCAVIIAIAIVYKLYIGSVSKTARTTALLSKGAKAYGVFSVLRAIGAGFSVLSAVGILVVLRYLPEWFKTTDVDQQISNYLAEKGAAFFLMLLAMAIVVFVMYILDAKIALGYAGYIRQTERSTRRYIDDSDEGSYHRTADEAYYKYGAGAGQNSAPTEDAVKTDGYGDNY